MKKIVIKIIRLLLGFMFCAFSTVIALKSNLGLSPWDVFHLGISNISNLTIGQSSILVSVIIVIITLFFKLEVGIGTIANMIIIGFFIDLINNADIISESNNLLSGVLMLICALFTMAIGSYLYIGCELGCGPRDGLMVVLVQKTGRSVVIIRFCIELGAVLIGWMLGGKVGIGTVITVISIGFFMQLVFKIFRFDVKVLRHKSIKDSLVYLNKYIMSK